MFRSAYDGRGQAVSELLGLDFDGDLSRTVQSGLADSDINTIVRRFGISNTLPSARVLPEFGDFTGVQDYQSALNGIMEADAAFSSLPAVVRARFANDPAKLWEFVHDPANHEEAARLGILEPVAAPPEPQLVRVVADGPPAVSGSV